MPKGFYNPSQITKHYNCLTRSHQAGLQDFNIRLGFKQGPASLRSLLSLRQYSCEQGTTEALFFRGLKWYLPTPRYNKKWSNTSGDRTSTAMLTDQWSCSLALKVVLWGKCSRQHVHILTLTMQKCWRLTGYCLPCSSFYVRKLAC